MSLDVLERNVYFHGHQRPPVVGSADSGELRSIVTGNATVLATAGFMTIVLSSAVEAQNGCLYWGNELGLDIDDLVSVDFWVKASASLAAATSMAFGVTSNRNDAIDSIGEAAIFRLVGSNALLVETDDGTNNNDDVATGLSLAATVRRCQIDFGTGVKTNAPYTLSKGGKASVRFSAENSQGLMRRVAETTLFDMSNYSGGLQLFAQVQKTSDAATGTLSIQRIRYRWRQS